MTTVWVPGDDLAEQLPLSDLLACIRSMRESVCNERGAEQARLHEKYNRQLAPHALKLGFYLVLVIEKKGDLSRIGELRFPDEI
jgi:hypothetical protein